MWLRQCHSRRFLIILITSMPSPSLRKRRPPWDWVGCMAFPPRRCAIPSPRADANLCTTTIPGCAAFSAAQALQHRPLTLYEDGHQTRDFVHVDDVVEANMLVLEKEAANAQAFNVGSGKSTTIGEYARQVLDRVPGSAGLEVCGDYRCGDNRHSVSSIEKLKHLGWMPKKDLGVILDDYLEWIEASGGIPLNLSDAAGEMRAAGILLSASSPIRSRPKKT